MRILYALLMVCSFYADAAAETNPLRWKGHEQTAATLSNLVIIGAIGSDTIHSLTAEKRTSAFLEQGCALGLALGVTELTKFVVHRTRPDGSDRKSFYSGHTATAMTSGWSVAVRVPFAMGAGGLRMAANKHYATDVATGAGVGLVARLLCDRWTR